MFDRLTRKREITDLEKTEIIIEYLKDKIEAYGEADAVEIQPTKLLEIILNFEERKRFFMTNRENYSYINKEISKRES